MKKVKRNTTKLFLQKGSCSHLFYYLLNQEFGNANEIEERAADPLAGGIYQMGYQCGMVWGSSLALGAESFRRYGNYSTAIFMTIKATQHVIESFIKYTESIECNDITQTDFTSKLSLAKYFFTGKFFTCFSLANKWAPEAIKAAHEGLSQEKITFPKKCFSCASEVLKKLGAKDEEIVMVAGFAGGLGLSGNGCGALSAAIWYNKFKEIKVNPELKYTLKDPSTQKIIDDFHEVTDFKVLCSDIVERKFSSIEDHSNYIENGGCRNIIDFLSHVK